MKMIMTLKNSLLAIATGALVLSMAACSNPQENPVKAAQKTMDLIIDGKTEEACDLMATSDGPIVRDTQEHATCVYYMSSMKAMVEPYQDNKLAVNSATIDEDTAEVTDDDVNDDFKEFFLQNPMDLIKFDNKWYVDLG